MKGMKFGLAVIVVVFLALGAFSPLHGSEKAMTLNDFIENAKKTIKSVSAAEAGAMHEKGGVLFLDVREPKEYKSGHIPGALNVPRGVLELEINRKAANRDADTG
jgi:3-mercaptopyruvate sulfurtransferase SseA